MEATIFDTSPKLAFGFCPLMAAWVSRKNRAYADTGLKKYRKNSNANLLCTQKYTCCGGAPIKSFKIVTTQAEPTAVAVRDRPIILFLTKN